MKAAGLLLAAGILGASVAAVAQEYPTKPVRLVIAQQPGSSADTQMRAIAQRLSVGWERQVIVDNRPGANGVIGMQEIARSPADGYTLGLAAPSPMTVNPFIYKNIPYKPLEDFVPITLLSTTSFVLVVNPALPVRSVADLVALAKQKPDQLTYSSPGIGNLSHLGAELLSAEAKIKARHIPNKGDAAAILDVMGGNTDFTLISLPGALPHIQSGKLRALALAGQKRNPALPDVPTLVEAGYPAVVIEGWGGLVAPAGTPAPVVAKVQREVARQMQGPELKEFFAKTGSDVVAGPPEAFSAFLRSETAKWSRVIKSAGIQLNE